MTCVRCQAIEAALAAGNEVALLDEFARQIDRLQHPQETQREDGCGVSCVPRVEHERVVGKLNARIAKLNGKRRAS